MAAKVQHFRHILFDSFRTFRREDKKAENYPVFVK